MTGVEAVSNGVMAFRDRHTKNAKTHADHHHRPARRAAGRHRAALPLLQHRRHRPRRARLRERALQLTARSWATGGSTTSPSPPFCWSWLSPPTRPLPIFPASPAPSRSTTICPTSSCFRGRRLLYSWGIYVLVALTGVAADRLRRRHRPAHPALRHRRIHGFHALPGRHGRALEAPGAKLRLRMFVNGLGAVATGITTLVVLVDEVCGGRMGHCAADSLSSFWLMAA